MFQFYRKHTTTEMETMYNPDYRELKPRGSRIYISPFSRINNIYDEYDHLGKAKY